MMLAVFSGQWIVNVHIWGYVVAIVIVIHNRVDDVLVVGWLRCFISDQV